MDTANSDHSDYGADYSGDIRESPLERARRENQEKLAAMVTVLE